VLVSVLDVLQQPLHSLPVPRHVVGTVHAVLCLVDVWWLLFSPPSRLQSTPLLIVEAARMAVSCAKSRGLSPGCRERAVL
jgi:hypothetical protein